MYLAAENGDRNGNGQVERSGVVVDFQLSLFRVGGAQCLLHNIRIYIY